MITYDGFPLVLPDPDTSLWIEENISPSWLIESAARTWPGAGSEGLPWRGYLPQGPIRVGVLSWPAGASRFACGHYLASEALIAYLRSQNEQVPRTLAIHDGRKGIEPELYALPPRPLARVELYTPGLYLLTLVDERYYWWFRSGEVDVLAGLTTWEDAYSSIADALGISIAVDAIDSAYLLPPKDAQQSYRPLPILLDAVAASVGQRIVRGLDGSVRAMNPRASLTAMQANQATYATSRLAGDSFDLVA